MRLYLKGNYQTSIYQSCMEYPWKIWFKERKGVQLDFSYAQDDDFYFSVCLDKHFSVDERWEAAFFKSGVNLWETFYREYLNLNFEKAYESEGREKGDYLRIVTTHQDILTVDKRALYILAIEVATAIDGQISEDDKESWLSIEEFKECHADLLSLSYDQAVDISLEELEFMEVVDEPLWGKLDRDREEYIRIHGEPELEDDEDDDDEEDE